MPKVKPASHTTKTTLRKRRRIKIPTIGPKFVRRTTRRRRRSKAQRPSWPALLIAIFAVIGIFFYLFPQTITTLVNNHTQSIQIVHHSGPYILTGKPTIDAAFINEVLQYYHSPAQGKGQALYDDGIKYHIDPAFALAFFMHESDLGTQGVARVTHSLGNIRATQGYDQYDGYRKYATWEDGFDDWYQLISTLYVQKWDLTSVEQIIPVYAPTSDNNNEQQYIHSVEYMVDAWRSGQINIS